MKTTLAASLGLLYLAAALPAPEPVERILPGSWEYTITSLRGPGCPDLGVDPEKQRATRLTFGQNTMDGSEIYYWFVAYPYLRVSLDGEQHSWCETELAYKEFNDYNTKVQSSDYRLRLHKNGTRVIATYDLEEGVQATFKFTYDTSDDEVTDTIVWKGPFASGQYEKPDVSPVSKEPELYKLPQCGAGKIKFRTDLYINGEEGKEGFVASEHYTDAAGKEQYYGVQQGFSYDWEKCGK